MEVFRKGKSTLGMKLCIYELSCAIDEKNQTTNSESGAFMRERERKKRKKNKAKSMSRFSRNGNSPLGREARGFYLTEKKNRREGR